MCKATTVVSRIEGNIRKFPKQAVCLVAFLAVCLSSCDSTKLPFQGFSLPGQGTSYDEIVAQTLLTSTRVSYPSADLSVAGPERLLYKESVEKVRTVYELVLGAILRERIDANSNENMLITVPRSIAEHPAINDTKGLTKTGKFTYNYSLQFSSESGATKVELGVFRQKGKFNVSGINKKPINVSLSLLRKWLVLETGNKGLHYIKAYGPPRPTMMAEKDGLVELQLVSRKELEGSKIRISTTSIEKLEIVRQVQEQLQDLGYSPGPADGLFGARTKQALKNFRNHQGLGNGAILDIDTLKALGL